MPIYEKLYLSRNNSSDQLHKKSAAKSFDNRSYSVSEFKSYKSPMPRIKEEKKRLPPTGKSKNVKFSQN